MKITQTQKVLNYLKIHGIGTTNELRSALSIVDVPKSVSILRDRGVEITAERNKDGTSTYTLGKHEERKPLRYEFINDVAVPVFEN